MPLAPIFLAMGIGFWFALPADPPGWSLAAAGSAALAMGLCAPRLPQAGRLLALGALFLSLGFAVAGLRAERVAAPVLDFRYYGPVEGRVRTLDRSVSDAVRVTLDQVVLADVAPGRTPERVRVALHGMAADRVPEPGERTILTAHLSPPGGPVAPGGFDFARIAWFDRLGAVGYTRSPALRLAPPEGARLARARLTMSQAIQARLPGGEGAMAAALATGDRSALRREDVEALRASNLSHLLAISGLHLGLLSGFVFAVVRLGLAAWPRLALRLPGKKIAAGAAIAAAAVYLALSGGNVATQRAFVMVACALGAVLVDRRALSFRALALAALIILAVTPESLAEAGFQMSFAATAALVAVFSGGAARRIAGLPAAMGWLAALVLSSAVAGLATAPVAAAQFNRIAEYGLLANLLAVPMMGTLVIPGAVVAALLTPFGLPGPGLWMMQTGCGWILAVAHAVAGMEGAVIGVPAPPGWMLPVLALAGLWAVLAPGWLRALALLPGAAALAIWSAVPGPSALVAGDAGLAAVRTPAGLALSKPRGAGFVAQSWLEDAGDFATQEEAAALPGFSGAAGARWAMLGDRRLWHLSGRGAAAAVTLACRDGAILVVAARLPGPPPGDCLLFDQTRLAETGALAFHLAPGGGLRIVPARDPGGDRRWTEWAGARQPRDQ